MKKVMILVILFGLLGGLVMFGIKNEKLQPKAHLSDKTTARLAFVTEVNSLDPRYGYEIPANLVIKMLFDGLMRLDSQGQPIPSVAEKVTVSEDLKTYTFHLRQTLWSNGDPVTAVDFAYAWKAVINPFSGSKGVSDFYPIKNVEAIVNGEKELQEVGIRAVDPQTLVIELEHPTPYFLELTTTSAYSPINAKTDQRNPNWSHTAADFVSNGPFILKEWRKGYELLFEKNPRYWDAQSVKLDMITASIVEDLSTQVALFEKGKLDWCGKPFSKLPLDAVPSLRKQQLIDVIPESAVYWYWMNTEKFPFNHKKFRQAFAYAVNRDEITRHLLQEDEKPALGVTQSRSQSGGYFPDGDLEKARALFNEGLAETGLTTDTFPKVLLSYCGIEVNQRLAQVIQQQWQHAFNIQVELVPQEWTAYYDNLSSGRFMIGGMSWHSRISDPIYNLQIFKFRSNGLNMTRWENTQYQQLLDQALVETDTDKRLQILKDAEAYLMDEMPVIPVYTLSLGFAKDKKLDGVYLSELNQIDFKWAHFD